MRAQCEQRALDLLQAWRQSDLDGLRGQELELARSHAALELEQWKAQVSQAAFEQLESWRAKDLEQVRVEQRNAAQAESSIAFEQWKLEPERSIRDDAIRKS
jgi:hypothetical protein